MTSLCIASCLYGCDCAKASLSCHRKCGVYFVQTVLLAQVPSQTVLGMPQFSQPSDIERFLSLTTPTLPTKIGAVPTLVCPLEPDLQMCCHVPWCLAMAAQPLLDIIEIMSCSI